MTLARVLTWPMVMAVHAYRWTLAPLLGGRCRFYPSCSEYALDALREHGPLRGTLLAIRRLSRCHPWGGHGVDLVPERRTPAEGSKGSDGAGTGEDASGTRSFSSSG